MERLAAAAVAAAVAAVMRTTNFNTAAEAEVEAEPAQQTAQVGPGVALVTAGVLARLVHPLRPGVAVAALDLALALAVVGVTTVLQEVLVGVLPMEAVAVAAVVAEP
jgi:hypothetical protein